MSSIQDPINFDECGCGYCPKEKFQMVARHMIRYQFLKAISKGMRTHGCPLIRSICPELKQYVPMVRIGEIVVGPLWNRGIEYDLTQEEPPWI